MNTEEAMKALLDRKKIRSPYWPKEDYIHIVNGRLLRPDGSSALLDEKICRTGWEIYEEPVKPMAEEEFLSRIVRLPFENHDRLYKWFKAGCPIESK